QHILPDHIAVTVPVGVLVFDFEPLPQTEAVTGGRGANGRKIHGFITLTFCQDGIGAPVAGIARDDVVNHFGTIFLPLKSGASQTDQTKTDGAAVVTIRIERLS